MAVTTETGAVILASPWQTTRRSQYTVGVWGGRSFRLRSQALHHKGRSPFEDLPIDMVASFAVNYMHLVCLGVMRELLHMWRLAASKNSASINVSINSTLNEYSRRLASDSDVYEDNQRTKSAIQTGTSNYIPVSAPSHGDNSLIVIRFYYTDTLDYRRWSVRLQHESIVACMCNMNGRASGKVLGSPSGGRWTIFQNKFSVRKWDLRSQTPHFHLNNLLKILMPLLSDLPANAGTLFGAAKFSAPVMAVRSGEYVHLGLPLTDRNADLSGCPSILEHYKDQPVLVDGTPAEASRHCDSSEIQLLTTGMISGFSFVAKSWFFGDQYVAWPKEREVQRMLEANERPSDGAKIYEVKVLRDGLKLDEPKLQLI
ncbi:hypothetical protein SprV_0301348000 [Sparganum proliferum]